jgi:hypothetical protein
MAYYLYGEDMAIGAVGPFATPRDAIGHMLLQEARGDAAILEGTTRLITEKSPLLEECFKYGTIATPQQDKANMSEKDKADLLDALAGVVKSLVAATLWDH